MDSRRVTQWAEDWLKQDLEGTAVKEKSWGSPDSGNFWRNTPYLLMGNKVQSPYLLTRPVSMLGLGVRGGPLPAPSPPSRGAVSTLGKVGTLVESLSRKIQG